MTPMPEPSTPGEGHQVVIRLLLGNDVARSSAEAIAAELFETVWTHGAVFAGDWEVEDG